MQKEIFDSDSDSEEQAIKHIQLKVDNRMSSEMRRKIFGHPAALIPFSDGYFGKTADIREVQFYNALKSTFSKEISTEHFPTVYATAYSSEEDQTPVRPGQTMLLDCVPIITKDKLGSKMPIELQADFAYGYNHPAIVDFKMGLRTWRIGASAKKARRRASRLYREPTRSLKFHVRAAMWKAPDPENWKKEGTVSFTDRDFGRNYSMAELDSFFRSFFKGPQQAIILCDKLQKMHDDILKLHDDYGVRFYSGSVCIVYDEDDPTHCDVKFLDFVKTYIHVEQEAEVQGETLKSVEDFVCEGIMNLRQKIAELYFRD